MSTVAQPILSVNEPAVNEPAVNEPVAHVLELLCQRALAQHPEEAARIQRGYAIAVAGGVHLSGVGLATVQSQRQRETWYTVHSQCTCWDTTRAPDGRCKHRWAKALMVQALTYMVQQSEAPAALLPQPYDFPPWTKYEATYQGPASGGEPVNGIAELLEPGLFVLWPEGVRMCWHCAYQEVALEPGIEEA